MDRFMLQDGQTVRQRLLEVSKKGNMAFISSLNPGVENILGTRMGDLRALAKEIAKSEQWQVFLSDPDCLYMEERMLYGLVLGYIRPDEDIECYLKRITPFVQMINSWSVCDAFRLAGTERYRQLHDVRIWEYLNGWMDSEKEYEVRFGVVMTLFYYIKEEYIDRLLERYASVCHDAYYVKMAIAWALAECYVKFQEKTFALLTSGRLDRFTLQKCIQKIQESYRVNDDGKRAVRSLRDSIVIKKL